MAQTPSNMLPLGAKAPEFSLVDTISGQTKNLHEIKGSKGTVVMFICNHCPFVVHVNSQLVQLAHHYTEKGIGFVAISSNDAINYPQDGPEKMKLHAQQNSYPFPYLYDETQEVARVFEAACTPDFYVFNSELKLVYRGQLDDSRPGNGIPLSGSDLRNAIDSVIKGHAISNTQKPSIGCNIKWKN